MAGSDKRPAPKKAFSPAKRFKPDAAGGGATGAPFKSGKPAFSKAPNGKAPFKSGKPAGGFKVAPSQGGKKVLGKPATGAATSSSFKPRPGQQAAGKPWQKPAAGGGPVTPASRREQKDASKLRKQGKKNYETIQDAVQLWEKLRPAKVPQEERAALAAKIIAKSHGKLVELANHHSASRVIQFVAQHGGPEVQAAVKAEVKDNVVALSKSKYGHFLVIKLIKICSKAEVPGLVKLFKGHVAELLRQPQGADVLVDLYDVAHTAQRNAMVAEFYGRDFALFDGVHQEAASVSHLREVLATASPTRRIAILQQLTKYMMPILEKAILHPPMTHRLIREFLDCAPGSTVEDVVDTLTQTGPAVLKMVHTHDGAAVACMLLAYGSAKDRKRMVKAMKGHVLTMATNEWAYTVLATALSVVDDTAMMLKVIVAEIKAELETLVDDANGHRVVLQLLCPDCRRYIPQAALDLLHPPKRTTRSTRAVSSAAADDDDDDEQPEKAAKKPKASKATAVKVEAGADGNAAAASAAAAGEDGAASVAPAAAELGEERELGVSKKDALARRRTLLGGGKGSLGEALTALCARRAGALLRSAYGADVVIEVSRGGEGGLLQDLCPAGVAAVQAAVLAEAHLGEDHAEQPPEATAAGPAEEAEAVAGPSGRWEHVMLNYWGSRALRRLILYSTGSGADAASAQEFTSQLWQQSVRGHCRRWVGTHAEKVLAALASCGVPDVASDVAKELPPLLPVAFDAWRQRFGAADGPPGGKRKHSAAAAGGQPPASKRGKGAKGGEGETSGVRQKAAGVATGAGAAGQADWDTVKHGLKPEAAVDDDAPQQVATRGPPAAAAGKKAQGGGRGRGGGVRGGRGGEAGRGGRGGEVGRGGRGGEAGRVGRGGGGASKAAGGRGAGGRGSKRG